MRRGGITTGKKGGNRVLVGTLGPAAFAELLSAAKQLKALAAEIKMAKFRQVVYQESEDGSKFKIVFPHGEYYYYFEETWGIHTNSRRSIRVRYSPIKTQALNACIKKYGSIMYSHIS